MYQVVKRDGKTVSFDISKISAAIKKAFESVEKPYDDNVIDFISLKVTADFADKIHDDKIAVEDIQDSVEKVLGEAGYDEINKRPEAHQLSGVTGWKRMCRGRFFGLIL